MVRAATRLAIAYTACSEHQVVRWSRPIRGLPGTPTGVRMSLLLRVALWLMSALTFSNFGLPEGLYS